MSPAELFEIEQDHEAALCEDSMRFPKYWEPAEFLNRSTSPGLCDFQGLVLRGEL